MLYGGTVSGSVCLAFRFLIDTFLDISALTLLLLRVFVRATSKGVSGPVDPLTGKRWDALRGWPSTPLTVMGSYGSRIKNVSFQIGKKL